MDTLRRPMKLASMAFTALAIVLAISSPGQVQARGGGGGGHSGGGGMHDGFGGHDGFGMHDGFGGHRDFNGHRDFHRGEHRRFGSGLDFFYDGDYPDSSDGDYPDASDDQEPAYWCPSYGAYYPSVTSCPESWEPVPAS